MEIEGGGGKRGAPEEESGFPLNVQPKAKMRLSDVEPWTNLPFTVGANLFAHMDLRTFTKYCTVSRAVKEWCRVLQEQYENLFVHMLEEMILNSDIQSILGACANRSSDVWKYAGFDNEEWLQTARQSGGGIQTYPQVRPEVWKTIFDTDVLPCIPPIFTATATTRPTYRRLGVFQWDDLLAAIYPTTDREARRDMIKDIVARGHAPYIDDDIYTFIMREAEIADRTKYLVLNAIVCRALLSGTLHYRDKANVPYVGEREWEDRRLPKPPPVWMYTISRETVREYSPARAHAELHPNIDAHPELTQNVFTFVDPDDRAQQYSTAAMEFGAATSDIAQGGDWLSVTILSTDDIRREILGKIRDAYPDVDSTAYEYSVASSDTLDRASVRAHLRAETSTAINTSSTPTSMVPGLFIESSAARQAPFRAVHATMSALSAAWGLAAEDTTDAIPRVLEISRLFATYDYATGRYKTTATTTTSTGSSYELERKTVFRADVTMPHSLELYASDLGPSEIISFDINDVDRAYFLFFVYPYMERVKWTDTNGSTFAYCMMLRVTHLVIPRGTPNLKLKKTFYVPVNFALRMSIDLYVHANLNFAHLLYNAEQRAVYRATYLSYDPLPSRHAHEPKKDPYLLIDTMTDANYVIPIERYFAIPESTLVGIEERGGIISPLASGRSLFRSLSPPVAIQRYLVMQLNMVREFLARFNTDDTVQYYRLQAQGTLAPFPIKSLINVMQWATEVLALIVGDRPPHTEMLPLWTTLHREFLFGKKRQATAIWGLREFSTPPARRANESDTDYNIRPMETQKIRYAVYSSIVKMWHIRRLLAVFRAYLLGTPNITPSILLFMNIARRIIHGDVTLTEQSVELSDQFAELRQMVIMIPDESLASSTAGARIQFSTSDSESDDDDDDEITDLLYPSTHSGALW